MTDYRTLPDDVKEELVFDALKFTKACIALSNIDGGDVAAWGERVSNAAWADVRQMSKTDIDKAIEAIELARQGQIGSRMQQIEVSKSKGFKPKGEQTQDEG